jgi:hypothetical protein
MLFFFTYKDYGFLSMHAQCLEKSPLLYAVLVDFYTSYLPSYLSKLFWKVVILKLPQKTLVLR